MNLMRQIYYLWWFEHTHTKRSLQNEISDGEKTTFFFVSRFISDGNSRKNYEKRFDLHNRIKNHAVPLHLNRWQVHDVCDCKNFSCWEVSSLSTDYPNAKMIIRLEGNLSILFGLCISSIVNGFFLLLRFRQWRFVTHKSHVEHVYEIHRGRLAMHLGVKQPIEIINNNLPRLTLTHGNVRAQHSHFLWIHF